MLSTEDLLTINELDLEPIKEKLMHHKAGKGWTQARAESAEHEYRRFLYLVKNFPDAPIAPDVEVDEFWHCHILDTKKYAADCQRIFGYFLHHFPYAGMRGEEDEAAMKRIRTSTAALYERTFGEEYSSGHTGSKRTAFSTAVRLSSAYTLSAAASAYCLTPARQTAYCIHEKQAAYCIHEKQAAYCITNEKLAAHCLTPSVDDCCVECPEQVETSAYRAPEQRIGFYLERPRLATA